MNILTRIGLWAALLLGLACASCSPDRVQLLDNVPASASMVMLIDADNLRNQLTEKHGKINDNEFLKLLDQSGSKYYVNIQDSLNNNYTIAQAADISKFGQVLAEAGFTAAPSALQGGNMYERAESYRYPRYAYVAENGLVILCGRAYKVSCDEMAGRIAELLRSAEVRPFSAVQGPAEYLESHSGLAMIALHQPGGTDKPWACISTESDGPNGALQATILNAAGEQVPIPGLVPYQKDFLRYAAPNPVFAAAIGLSKDTDWDFVFAALGQAVPRAQAAIARSVVESLDGTVAIAVSNPNDVAPDEWDFPTMYYVVMAHMSEKDAQNVMAMVDKFGKSNGTKGSGPLGMSVYKYPYGSVYIGMVDGYLTIANYDITTGGNTDLGPTFNGGEAAMYLNLPLSMMQLGDGTATVTGKMGDDKLLIRVKLNDTDLSIMDLIDKTL